MAEQAAPNQEQTEQHEPAPEAGFSFLESLYPSADAENEGEESTESAEAETTAETEAETGEQSSEGEASEEVVSTLSQLLEQQEWDEEWFHGLKVPVKVDGTPAEATMKELVASYQIQQAAQHRLEEAKSQAQAIKQEAAQERDSLRADLGTAAGLVQLAETLFAKDISEANLAKLREENPEQYLIEKDRFAERRQALETVKAQLRANVQKAFEQQPTAPETFEKERQTLIQKAPELAEQDARMELAQYLIGQGFSQEELGSVADHRLFLLAHKARLHDATKEKVDTARKKVATIPKVMKPGAAQQKAPQKPKDAASILYG